MENLKTSKKLSLVAILLVSCTLITVGVAQAKPQRTVINFTCYLLPTGLPERMWLSEEGIMHYRNTPHEGWVETSETDFYGIFYYMSDFNLDIATMIGNGGGQFGFEGYYLGEYATFYGRLVFKYDNGHIVSELVAHGTGSLDGLIKISSDGWQATGYYTSQLTIWN